MRRGFFLRLAFINIKKNKEIFLPYMITGIVCVAMLYMMLFIKRSTSLENMLGGSDVAIIMSLGIIVVGIFSFVFLLYTNSILMKRRQNEIGLYNILGMEKGHIGRMLFLETLITSFVNIGGGLLAGILGCKLALLLLLKLMHLPVVFGFYISAGGAVICCIVFGLIYLIAFAWNICRVHMSHPVELLSGSRAGEKEPKAKWLLALAGFACLGAGYYIAVSTQSPLDAFVLFFLAVVLVMAGTYLLFTAGTIAVLKILRWNKRFYYRAKNFTSVSGMIYRMKQNAVGLANICILSTGVLLMLSSTVCLYFGMKDAIAYRYPRDIQLIFRNVEAEEAVRILDRMSAVLREEKVPAENVLSRISSDFSVKREGDTILLPGGEQGLFAAMDDLRIILKESYEEAAGEDTGLSDGEALVYCEEELPSDVLYLGEEAWKIRGFLTEEPLVLGSDDVMREVLDETIVMVVTLNDYGKIFSIVNERYGTNLMPDADISLDVSGTKEDESYWADVICSHRTEIAEEEVKGLKEGERDSFFISTNVRVWDDDTYTRMYGGFFFLGLFLGGLFLMGVTMIIFYKQLSEGYDDKGRYDVMRKVGMSSSEVKGSIHRQILMVFFLPLLTAALHIAMAFPMVKKLLMVLGMFNTKLFILCTAGTILVFAAVYGIIYCITAKVYYRILDGGNS